MCKETKKNLGQSSTEVAIVLGLLVVPALIACTHLINTEWNQSQCAFQSYQQARITLLRTRAPVSVEVSCGGAKEKISLVPLESLDHDKGGLDFDDSINAVSALWEQLTR